MKFFWRYIFPPIYGILIYLTIRVLLDTVTGMRWWHRNWQINTLDIVTTILFSYGSTRNGRRPISVPDVSAASCFS